MTHVAIRKLSGIVVVFLFGLAVLGSNPAYSADWWPWSKNENAGQTKIYVDKENNAKPRRTWGEYLLGKESGTTAGGRSVFNRVTPDKPVEHKISDGEPKTVEELVARAKKLRAPHEAVIMRVQAEDRKRLALLDQEERMRSIEMQAKSRRNTDAQLRRERAISADGPMSVPGQPGEGKKVIYNKPTVQPPAKVFTDYR